ncbi:MAG: hypothetical protein DMF83_23830 [Acidobacteria bacterium]|nr:MAG: hypothetical protein DMF83_23830 [Acidobacteriota bacterium]
MANLRLMPAAGGGAVEIDKDKILVGRDPGCDIVVSDGSVSRKHALVERRTAGWFVVDQGSANGTFLDSQRVAESPLHNGQELRFGAIAYKVEMESEDSATTILTTGPEVTVIAPTPIAPPPRPAPPASPPAAPPRPVPPAAAPPPVPRPAPPAAPPPIPRPAPPAAGPPPIPPRPAAPPAVPPRPSAPPPRPAAPPPRPPAPARPGPPPPPAPVPGEAPPSPKKGRGPLFWTLTGCCGCLLLGFIGVGLIGGAAFWMTGDAVAAVRSQLRELKGGDIDGAYARLSGSAQARMSRPAFEAFVGRHPGLRENTDSTFWSRSVKNDTATLSGLLTSASGTRERVTYELVKEGGAWKVSSIDVEGDTGGGTSASGGGGGGGDGGGGALTLETTGVEKGAVTGGTAVTIKTQVSGFKVRPEGGAYAMDLVEDVITVGPTGEAVPGLQQKEVERLRTPTTLEQGAIANFTTKLTLSGDSAPGRYTVRLTIRDQVGGAAKTHEVAFDLP